jgi:hypothetical protein
VIEDFRGFPPSSPNSGLISLDRTSSHTLSSNDSQQSSCHSRFVIWSVKPWNKFLLSLRSPTLIG